MRLDERPHIVVRILQQELEPIHLDCVSNGEIARAVVHWIAGIAARKRYLACIKELPAQDSRVSLRRLVDGDVVIGKVEGDDESARDVLGLRVHKLAQEAQNLVAKLKELEVILLRRLRDQRDARLQCVLGLPNARVGGDGHNGRCGKRFSDVDWAEISHAKVAAVEFLGELVALVE